MKKLIPLLVVLGAAGIPAAASSYYISPDVPTDDPAVAVPTYLPWEIVRVDSGVYSSGLLFPAYTAVDSLHQMCIGHWLFSVEVPTELPPASGTIYDPRDVIRYDPVGVIYSVFFSGAAAGVPVGSQVDAAFLDGGDTADLILSFDVPTTIGAATYDPSDLVRWAGGSFSLFFDASAAGPGIAADTNVTGADRRGTLDVMTFDIPTTLGVPTYLPGELVSWNGAAFASFFLDPLWPIESRADAMSFLPDPGSVPPTMTVVKSTITAGDLTLSWSPATSVGGEDYGIYEGTIGSFYSHTSIDCSDNGGDLTEEVTPSSGDRYYLVVPLNPNDEGSYGRDSGTSQRPVGNPSRCRPTQALACP